MNSLLLRATLAAARLRTPLQTKNPAVSAWRDRRLPSGGGRARGMCQKATTTKSLYEVLGVKENATPAEIKSAFYERSKLVHPDMTHSETAEAASASETAFRELAAAYEVLSSVSERQKYDEERRSQFSGRGREERRPEWERSARRKETFGRDNPDWGRRVEVDLSQERMEKAWKAYKERWQREEQRLQELEVKKKAFREDLEERRAGMANMTEDERLKFLEEMRLFKTTFGGKKKKEIRREEPANQKVDSSEKEKTAHEASADLNQKISSEWYRIQAENERKREAFEEKVKREDRDFMGMGTEGNRFETSEGEDPLFAGLKKDGDHLNREFLKKGFEESKARIKAANQTWKEGEFFSDSGGTSHHAGSYVGRAFAISFAGWGGVILIFTLSAASVLQSLLQGETNPYMIELEKARQEKNKKKDSC